ncbi:MAG: TonB-dependent receptor, partial [Gloeobacteraceae cyanobacterium ES-bin-316]|nr:TonB-dependent receptor [Ferruginibacter sp.]
MKQFLIFMFFFIAGIYSLRAQEPKAITNLTQKIKGVLLDADSKKPLEGATINLLNTGSKTLSDQAGQFYFNQVPVGRQALEITMMGYENKQVAEIVVSSGKEVSLTISLTEKISRLGEVTVLSTKNRIKPNNEFATVSARSFSVEDTKRYPAAAFDPGRMAQNFAGVSNNGDGSNEIVVRGNSPRGVLWRLEGIEIPSPNHFGSLGNTGGAISMLSSSTMGSSDFYTGAFPAEFGNATSGAFDLNFRNGNKDKKEYSFMLGLLGVEAAAEGPFKKGSQSSYLVNYRYSTVSLLEDFLDLGGVSPDYQDLSFKLNFPTTRAGTFSFFGLGGINQAVKKPVNDSTKWTDDDPNFVLDAPGKLGVAGLTHQFFITKNSFVKTIFSVSGQSAKAVIDTLNPADQYKKVPVGFEKDIDI